MKRKKPTLKKKGLKRHHKIILMSAFGAVALAIPFFGTSSSHISSLSGMITKPEIKMSCQTTSGTPCPVPSISLTTHVKYLSCSECSSKTLCFSASKKIAYCGGQLNSSQTPSDASCVSCPHITGNPTPAPTYHPIPSCIIRVPETNTLKPIYKYVPCAVSNGNN